jgi:hypothetical protein
VFGHDVAGVFLAAFFVGGEGVVMAKLRDWKVRVGRELLRQRMIAVLSDPAHVGLSYAKLRKKVGVGMWRFKQALTAEVKAEVEARLAGEMTPMQMKDMDRAMLAEAKKGNVVAAKILYARAAGVVEAEEPPSLEEMERMVVEMRNQRLETRD